MLLNELNGLNIAFPQSKYPHYGQIGILDLCGFCQVGGGGGAEVTIQCFFIYFEQCIQLKRIHPINIT